MSSRFGKSASWRAMEQGHVKPPFRTENTHQTVDSLHPIDLRVKLEKIVVRFM